MAEYSDVNEDSDVYYSGIYWNDYEVVRRRWNEWISGDPDRDWFEHFAAQSRPPFTRALVLNCGNGWVERDLVGRGHIKEAVGTDYAQDLLDQALTAARNEGLAPDLPPGEHQYRSLAAGRVRPRHQPRRGPSHHRARPGVS